MTLNTRLLNKYYQIYRILPIAKYSNVRVRFAPSPTGYLHLGGLRTALYNYFFAKSHNGKFILRIEDTDQTRLVKDSLYSIENDLKWFSIIPDESPENKEKYGPYLQSRRTNIYREHIEVLLEKGFAYRCFCSPHRLNSIKLNLNGASYDNHCRSLNAEQIKQFLQNGIPYCIRFKLNVIEVEPFTDIIYDYKDNLLPDSGGDFVLLKSDGIPTYHFANVVDDHLMKISHVLRGNEWISAVPKHVLIYKAFNWSVPTFGHLPQFLNEDGTKLSKRDSDLTVSELRSQGYSPLSIINYITSVSGGFRHSGKPEGNFKTMDQLIANFEIKLLMKSSCRFEKIKLMHFSRMQLKKTLEDPNATDTLVTLLRERLENKIESLDVKLTDEYIKSILYWSQNRIYKWKDLLSQDYSFLWSRPKQLTSEDISSFKFDTKSVICEVLSRLSSLQEIEFTSEKISSHLKDIQQELGINKVTLMQFVRLIICGIKEGPPLSQVMYILGRKRSLERLKDVQLFNS